MMLFGSGLELECQNLLKETHTNCAPIAAYPIGYFIHYHIWDSILEKGGIDPHILASGLYTHNLIRYKIFLSDNPLTRRPQQA